MSKKIFYIYKSTKTLTYERVYPSLRQRIIVRFTPFVRR